MSDECSTLKMLGSQTEASLLHFFLLHLKIYAANDTELVVEKFCVKTQLCNFNSTDAATFAWLQSFARLCFAVMHVMHASAWFAWQSFVSQQSFVGQQKHAVLPGTAMHWSCCSVLPGTGRSILSLLTPTVGNLVFNPLH